MRKVRRMFILLLLPGLIWGLSSACGLWGGDSPAAEATTEQQSGVEPSAQTGETADTSEPADKEQAVEKQEPIEVRDPTTVLAAAQLLDLRGLSLPSEIKAMGQNEVGYLSFELPTGDVASVVDLYQSDFIERGWQNEVDLEFTDETTANRYFSQDGFTVSLSVSKIGEGAMVTFTNHGNIDLRTLPQTTDAEPLYQFPHTLGYLSASEVSDVVDFTRQALAAQGWQEYTMPDTATANNADSQSSMFIQNGLELSAFISIAPAQENKTSVQYAITLLPLDLPVYDEAIGLEYDKHTPYLSYKTATGIETLADFYLEQMSDLGWIEMPETATVTPEHAALFFANEAEQLTLMIELVLIDGQTRVTSRQFDAEEVLALQESLTESDPLAEDITAAETGPPALPTPDDAQDVVYDADFAEISYTSPSDIETLVEFYRQTLPAEGWQEDEDFSFVDETFASLDFTQGETSLTVELFDDGSGEVTGARLYGFGPMWGTEMDDLVDTAPYLQAVNLPITADAEDVAYDDFSEQVTFTSPSDIETLTEFYREELIIQGWEEDEEFSYIDETFASLDFAQDEANLTVDLFKDGSGGVTEVTLYGHGLVWDTDTTTDTGSSSSDDLTLVEENKFLIPSNNTGFFSEGSEFSKTMTVYTPADFETLAALYERELPSYGGELLGHTIQTSEATFNVAEPEGELLITLQIVDGETEITMSRKDADAAAEAGILPATGQGRIYLGNILETGDIIVAIEGQEISVPPSDPQAESPDEFEYVDLEPGTYPITLTLPDGDEVSDEVELKADSVLMLLMDTDGLWPLTIY